MGKRILVVEDEEDNLTLLIHILKYLLGQDQLVVAKDGHEAMMLAYQQRPEIILMDLSLPKLDGWEAVRSLRADQGFRNIPIIALTAHAMAGDKQKALDAGCTDYFTKPIDIDRFMPFIQPYLAEAAKPNASEPQRPEEEKPEVSVSSVSTAASADTPPSAPPQTTAPTSGLLPPDGPSPDRQTPESMTSASVIRNTGNSQAVSADDDHSTGED